MRKAAFGLIGLGMGVALICFCGDSSTSPKVEAVTTVPISSLRLDNTAVTGWTPVAGDYVEGDTSSLCSAIDGSCTKYIGYGMSRFFREFLANGNDTLQLTVMDFATVQASKNNYGFFKTNLNGGGMLGTHSIDTVFYSQTDYYTTVLIAINKYYLELSFFNRVVDPSDAVALAAEKAGLRASALSFVGKFQDILK